MLRMFAGSVVDPVLIVSPLRGVVCQDGLAAALACVADKLQGFVSDAGLGQAAKAGAFAYVAGYF